MRTLSRPTPALDLYLITNDINLRRQPSLRSQLNQIRMWVRQGRTDPWIAHKLDVSVEELARFKRDHDLEADGDGGGRARPADPLSVPPPEPRAEEPEELEEDELGEEDELEREPRRRGRGRRGGRRGGRPVADEEAEEVEDDEELVSAAAPEGSADDTEDGVPRKRRRRGRRGGRRHRGRRNAYEATFDQGEEGSGLWLDPSVADDTVYSEHRAGHRAVTVTVEAEAITIRRADAGRSEPAADEAADEVPDD